MKIIIAGAGIIGTNLAQYLTQENHEVYLIDADEAVARKVDEKIDVKVINGNAADPDTLRRLGMANVDLMIAVTTSDEANLIVCSLAAGMGAKRRIARVRNTSLSRILTAKGFEHFKIDEVINPEQVAAESIIKTIKAPGSREVADFVEGRILLRSFEISANSPLNDVTVGDLSDEDFPWPFLLIALVRKGKVIIPKGDTHLQIDDVIYVLLPQQSLGEFLTFVDPDIKMPKKIVIYGATDIGERVAMGIKPFIKDIILLEEDPQKAEDVAGRLESARIINGSASENDILKECGMEVADAFIAASVNDHSNLVSAVLAKKMGAKQTIITTQQPDYISIVDALDIDVIINPRLLAVDQILRLVRGKGIQSVTKLMECDAEALEFIPEEGSPITKSPIKDIKFPKNSIVGAVYSGEEVTLAKGDTHIKAGERVIVFTQESAVKSLQQLFTKSKNVF